MRMSGMGSAAVVRLGFVDDGFWHHPVVPKYSLDDGS
jgi:hypothetical protein